MIESVFINFNDIRAVFYKSIFFNSFYLTIYEIQYGTFIWFLFSGLVRVLFLNLCKQILNDTDKKVLRNFYDLPAFYILGLNIHNSLIEFSLKSQFYQASTTENISNRNPNRVTTSKICFPRIH